jgi:hypothetical protein
MSGSFEANINDSMTGDADAELMADDASMSADAYAAVYRIDPMTKIAVSKHYGPMWKGKLDAGIKNRKDFVDAGDECVSYYNNNQLSHRVSGTGDVAGNRYYSKRRNAKWSETENIVYANVRAIMPALYAKNPQGEFSTPNEDNKAFVQTLEKLVNTLASLTTSPGLNLRVHAKQAVLSAELTNLGWIHYGYTERGESDAAAQELLAQKSAELESAQNTTDIRRIEGEIMALEEVLTVAQPPGPWAAYRPMQDVVVDADSTMPDFSDAAWMAVKLYYPTEYLNAKYGQRVDPADPKSKVMSLYEPTDVLLGGDGTAGDEGDTFKLINTEENAHRFGYSNTEQLRRAFRTACWMIYDKVTRRVFLYAANKMTDWPIWVANDPYGLPQFFPLEPLYFNTTPVGNQARSNVTYYLDQQDSINEIHDEFRRSRQDIRESVLFNSKLHRETVEKWLQGGDSNAYSVDVPDGMTMQQMIFAKPNAMMGALPLFDPTRLMQSVDRISGVSDVLRNAQFKTNTTNKAIEQYNSTTGMRLDEKIDEIETFIGRVLYGIGFICAQFMRSEDVAALIGSTYAADWQQKSAVDLRNLFVCQVVGGSTQKPTTQAKQQLALQLAELLSKFAQFAPQTVLTTTLQMLADAYSEMPLPAGTFERIAQEVQLAMERGNSVQGAGGGGQNPDGGGGGDPLAELAATVDGLPPDAKRALGEAIARGVPVEEALTAVVQATQQASQPQQQ